MQSNVLTQTSASGWPRRRWFSKGFLRNLLDSLTDGVLFAGADGRILYFNRAAGEIIGLPLESVPPSDWSRHYGLYQRDTTSLYPPRELPLARALAGETVRDCEVYIRNRGVPDGLWISVNANPLRERSRGIIGGIVVFRDITRRKRDREQVELLSAVVEQTADSVLVTSPDGTIEYVNDAFEKMTGFAKHEALGRSPRVLKSGEHPPAFYQCLWQTLMNGDVFRATLTDRKKSGEQFQVEQTITPIKNSDQEITHLVSVGRDVTELRKAECRKRELLLARGVQQKLYPSSPPVVEGFELAGQALMADVVGGDYWDLFLGDESDLVIAIGDASGHGFDSTLLMAETRAYLRSITRMTRDPGETLTWINRVLTPDLETNRFVTLLVAWLDPASRTLSYASAGHSTGYLLDSAGRVKKQLTSTGIILGPFPAASYRSCNGIAIAKGDLIVLVTDGVTEIEGPTGDAFAGEAIVRVARAHRQESPSRIITEIQTAALAFSDTGKPQDDMTIVVCKATA